MNVRKRSGNIVPFQKEFISRAISLAAAAAGEHNEEAIAAATDAVEARLLEKGVDIVDIDRIQDTVEEILFEHNQYRTVRAYMMYRMEKDKIRAQEDEFGEGLLSRDFLSKYKHAPNPMEQLGSFVFTRTYSRYLPKRNRREFWWETVRRAVDGFFVSNYAGKTPFAALNLIYPFIMILGAIGFMFGSGGGALIAKTLGMGEKEEANEQFSLFVYSALFIGIILTVVSFFIIEPVAILLGAKGAMIADCVTYGKIVLSVLPFYMLQYEFQSYFIVAEKPQLGLIVTLICGILNMILDAVFLAVFNWGLAGAALATALSQSFGGLLPLIYFGRKNPTLLKLGKCKLNFMHLFKACVNGSSELMSNISMSIVSMLYNVQLLSYAGEDGVAAYGVLMYVNMIFIAGFIGYSTGIAPVVGYHYGAENHGELKGLLSKSFRIIGISSIVMFAAAELLATPLAKIFVSYDSDLLALTERAFFIYSFSFLFAGMAIFGSAFFTALNDGLTSALISFLRSLVFQIAAVLIFPILMGIDGIWLSIVAAELFAATVSIIFIFLKKGKYHYM